VVATRRPRERRGWLPGSELRWDEVPRDSGVEASGAEVRAAARRAHGGGVEHRAAAAGGPRDGGEARSAEEQHQVLRRARKGPLCDGTTPCAAGLRRWREGDGSGAGGRGH